MDVAIFVLVLLCNVLVFLTPGTIISTTASVVPVAERKWPSLDGNPPLFMGHRGELVLMPEHTLGSYEIAVIHEADYIEPDLMLTKDGYLVCYHDVGLKDGTNVENLPQFAHLQRNFSEVLGNKNITILNDWFVGDFTLVELRELKVEQRQVGIRPQYFNAMFPIPTFEEYLDVIMNMSVKMNKAIGIIPELKHPAYHNSQHSSEGPRYMENLALATLKSYGYPITAEDAPSCGIPTPNLDSNDKVNKDIIQCGNIIIQCFEKDTLLYLSNITNIELMMLVEDDASLLTYEGFDEVASFARYYCITKSYLLNVGRRGYGSAEEVDAPGDLIPREVFVEEGHKRNMSMGIYTINDSREDPDKFEELGQLFTMGIDFLFVENIQEAREARQSFDCNITLYE